MHDLYKNTWLKIVEKKIGGNEFDFLQIQNCHWLIKSLTDRCTVYTIENRDRKEKSVRNEFDFFET